MQQNKKKTLAILFILITLFSMIAVTYAFFAGSVNNDNPQTAIIETGTMRLTFADGDVGVSGRLNFGDSITKLFTLENTGTVEATVDLYWKELTNSYLHGSLMYKLEYATSQNGTKSIAVNNSPVPTSETSLQTELATQLTVPVNTKYYYTLTITLVNSKTIDQTADLSASFASGFDIESVQKYPMLAASDTWYTQGGTTIKRNSITEINIEDSYNPTGTVTSSWDASAAKDGSIMAYVEGTKLTIAGNGSGKIAMNPDSSWAFSDHNTTDYFSKASSFTNANLLYAGNVTTMFRLFQMCHMKTINVKDWNTSNVTNMQAVFSMCSSLGNIIVDNWNVSNVTLMTGIFQGAVKIPSLNLRKWNTSNVTDMGQMFMSIDSYGPMALTTVGDISKWDVSNVTSMQGMFQLCTSLTSLDLSNWDVGKVTNFQAFLIGSNSIMTIKSVGNLSNWNVSNVTNMQAMFGDCKYLTQLGDISKWNVNKVQNMSQMFYGCESLTNLNLSDWNTSNVTTFREMFINCYKLQELNIQNFNTKKATNMASMFSNMTSLNKITLGENFSFTGNGNATSVLPIPTSGYWYNSNGQAFAPADIPNLTAGTYYSTKKISDSLPFEDIQLVEYIESDGNQYIDTNYIPTGKLSVTGKVRIPNITDEIAIVGTKQSGWELGFNLGTRMFSYSSYAGSSVAVTPATALYEKIIEFTAINDYNNKKRSLRLNVDNSYNEGELNDQLYKNTLYIFNYRGARSFIGRCYELKIYNDDVLVRHFVPCYRRSDGSVGMYDKVNNIFYMNQGSGTFIKGPNVNS